MTWIKLNLVVSQLLHEKKLMIEPDIFHAVVFFINNKASLSSIQEEFLFRNLSLSPPDFSEKTF